MQFFKNPNFSIIDKRKISYVLSGILILVSIVSLVINGGPKYNIDFVGGSLLHLKFENTVQVEDIRDSVNELNYDAEVKYFGNENEVAIRVALGKGTVGEVANNISDKLKQDFPNNSFVEMSNGTVTAKIGKELIVDALWAIFWSMVLVLIYIMVRFELKFSIGAIAALAHDIIITLGVFSVLGIEISAPIIAAILMIVGYSLNDTIVVFDRIRENIKTGNRSIKNIVPTVNESLNETLSRTVVTSITTLFVVVVLYFFGGEVLKSFSFALIIGILAGTYSSIFVASPIVVDWKSNKA